MNIPSYVFIILFYLGVFLLVYFNRKRFEIHLKVFALLKTKIGISLMDKIGKRFAKPIRMLGYSGIIVCFLAMLFVIFLLGQGVYNLFFFPDAPATIAPVIPGVKIPGTNFQIPFVEGIIAIFIVAVVHEFGHGVMARAHKVEVKATGLLIAGPIFGAFVEPDEKSLSKKNDVVQHSIFAAGPYFNFLFAAILFALIFFVMSPALSSLFEPTGVSFSNLAKGSPAEISGLKADVVYDHFNGKEMKNLTVMFLELQKSKPGDKVVISNLDSSHEFSLAGSPSNSTVPFMGLVGISNRYQGDEHFGFKSYIFFLDLFKLMFVLSIGIGTANLLPIGPIDGGRMLLLVNMRLFGEKRGNDLWAKMSIALLFVLLLLLTPIFRATFYSIFG